MKSRVHVQVDRGPARVARNLVYALLVATLPLAAPYARAQGPTIPDLDVTGPPAGFQMASRLMTSGTRMQVRLTVPGKGTVEVPKFNGTFFYDPAHPEATSGTLLFRPDRFEDIEGSLAQKLIQELDYDHHPFFAFQSRSAKATRDGIDLRGKFIVKDRETDATLRLKSPGKVAVNEKHESWVRIQATLQVDASKVGLESLGKSLEFELSMFLFGYTPDSAKATEIDVAALDQSPPVLPKEAGELSNAGWYLILTQRYEEAIAAFDQSIALDPSNVNTYLRRGDAYVFNGDYGKAMGTYEAVSTQMPVHPHMMELSKVLNREYLTPERLNEASKRWLARTSG